MSRLIRNLKQSADDYQVVPDDAPIPETGNVLLALHRFTLEAGQLSDLGRVGVRLPNTTDIEQCWPQIQGCSLIALEFPTFPDGRAYSQARILRGHFRYTGEIRATGAAVVLDQLQSMQRCGINAFELRADQDAAACASALAQPLLAYQTAADLTVPVIASRRKASGQ